MSDPKRLLDELGPGLERDLLAAAGAERAPSAARERVALGLFGPPAALPIVASASAASPTGAASTSSLFASALKWLAIGAAAGGMSGAIGGAIAEPEPERAPPAAVDTPSVRAEPTVAVAPKRVEAHAPAPVEPERTPPKPRARSLESNEGTVVIGSPALATEAASLERIRVLSRKDPRRALAELDHHDARFSAHGVLAEKSRALRAQIALRSAR
jgi:hypothetical protein